MPLNPILQRWFVAGTDTDIGKTVVSRALIQGFNHRGEQTVGYKPVASGCTLTPNGLRNHDALLLQAVSSGEPEYHHINPIALARATSPHLASQEQALKIDLARLSDGLNHLEMRANRIIIEGAGGWFTPLNHQQTFADWVIQEQLPVILVVGIKLGCINHALLTAQIIERQGLTLAGWIANEIQPGYADYAEYIETLTQFITAPLLGMIPHLSPNELEQDHSHYINLSLLENSYDSGKR